MRGMVSIVGVGVDLVEISTIQKARFKNRIAEYFLTNEERKDIPRGSRLPQHLASRFALKEAVIKAFPGTLSPFDFMIVKTGEKLRITFFDNEREREYSVFPSITHSEHLAGAIAVITRKN